MEQTSGRVAPVLTRDGLVVALCLLAACLIAWGWLLREAALMSPGVMASMPDMAAPGPAAGTFAYFAAAALMWFLMMTAMMLPSASPMILLYARVAAKARMEGGGIAPAFLFAAIYAGLWGVVSLAAAALQAALVGAHLLYAGGLSLRSPLAAAALLLAVGVYQLSPAKRTCLDLCRAPVSSLMRWWRPGWEGAARLGVMHGLYCIGCCWALMALLFVGGVMNLAWVAGLGLLVGIEKLAPFGSVAVKIAGVVAIAAALVVAGFAIVGVR